MLAYLLDCQVDDSLDRRSAETHVGFLMPEVVLRQLPLEACMLLFNGRIEVMEAVLSVRAEHRLLRHVVPDSSNRVVDFPTGHSSASIDEILILVTQDAQDLSIKALWTRVSGAHHQRRVGVLHDGVGSVVEYSSTFLDTPDGR